MQDQESGIAIMPLTLPFTESGDCLVMVDMTGYSVLFAQGYDCLRICIRLCSVTVLMDIGTHLL